MHHYTVVDARGRVLAAGFCCDLCDRLRPIGQVDVVDAGLFDRGTVACLPCQAEIEQHCAGADYELSPEDFDDVPAANDDADDRAAE